MIYSKDLRQKVVHFVKAGASKAAAARKFDVSPRTVFYWLSRETLEPSKALTRKRKLDKDMLIQHVKEHPDATLHERAAHFGVRLYAIQFAFRRLGISKKNDALR